jgi:hypothetical protein
LATGSTNEHSQSDSFSLLNNAFQLFVFTDNCWSQPTYTVGVLVTLILLWPCALAVEGWCFFFAYSRFGVIRQVVFAYREEDIHQTKASLIPKGDKYAHW